MAPQKEKEKTAVVAACNSEATIGGEQQVQKHQQQCQQQQDKKRIARALNGDEVYATVCWVGDSHDTRIDRKKQVVKAVQKS